MLRRTRGSSSSPNRSEFSSAIGPRAHREDVADDAADARGRALVRLDERRMVVRFDLEDRREPVADVNGAGVLARSLQHARAGRREIAEMHARALVAAVLGPHHRENSQLGEARLAAERLDDALVLLVVQSVPFDASPGRASAARS